KSQAQMIETTTPKVAAASAVIFSGDAGTGKARYFEFVQGTSNKFWEISQSGNDLTTRWGRIGSNGQSKTKSFPDERSATDAVSKLIKEKTAEGYVESQR